MEANGHANGNGQAIVMEVATRKATNGRAPILSLVDREYLKSTANIPRAAWEAIAYLYSEADQATLRVKAQAVPAALEWVRASIIKDWTQMLGWLDEILLQSQSIEALRSWQMMTGLQTVHTGDPRPSGAVMPDFPQPQAPGTQERKKMKLRGT